MSEKDFVLQGNMPGAIRSDEDMLLIDKDAAEEALNSIKSNWLRF